MQMTTIEMDQAEARKLYLEYRDAVRERHDSELEQIMRGYKALARGHQVIDLAATIRAGGTITHTWKGWGGGGRGQGEHIAHLPRLALMRADQQWCWVRVSSDGSVLFHHSQDPPTSRAVRNVVRLPAGTVPAELAEITYETGWRLLHRALVPPVPPAHMPAHGLGNYHVLWEAEWEHVAPKDPALLRHIGGDLYAVLATWDLTELERTVLAGRFRRDLP